MFINSFLVVYAWNPNSNTITYHGGNRGMRMINFQTGVNSDLPDYRPRLFKIHGIAMLVLWGVLLPSKYNSRIIFFFHELFIPY